MDLEVLAQNAKVKSSFPWLNAKAKAFCRVRGVALGKPPLRRSAVPLWGSFAPSTSHSGRAISKRDISEKTWASLLR